MTDPYTLISDSNRQLLREIQSEINDLEEQRLLQNSRRLGEPDHNDIFLAAEVGQTIYDIFEYARRPKREVIQYLLQNMPQTLDKILTNTRSRAGS